MPGLLTLLQNRARSRRIYAVSVEQHALHNRFTAETRYDTGNFFRRFEGCCRVAFRHHAASSESRDDYDVCHVAELPQKNFGDFSKELVLDPIQP